MLCGDRTGDQGLSGWGHDSATEDLCRDKEFSVVTGLAARWLLGCRELGFWIAIRPGWWGSVATECAATTLSVRVTEHAVRTIARAMCTQCAHDRTCDGAQCCVLFRSLFMNTVPKKIRVQK